ncbi:hypothetical protein [Halorussus halophilus]|uniref:hypothetical protein n=1 Tax=Halorussus halophilus TaxID=2650975 RepID=UPI00130196F4|nr:hypothetical protein [Halorussus halophilus]
MESFDQSRRALAVDLTLVAAVCVLLVVVYLAVPSAIQDRLAFDHAAFAPVTLLTAAYVHAGEAHLLNNVGGFLSLAIVTYFVCLHTHRRRWFLRTFAVFLIVLPVAVNLTSYAILASRYPGAEPVSRGFSGVVAGFAGFLLVALVVQLRVTYSRATAFFVGQFAVLLLLGELLWIYADVVAPLEAGAVVLGLALSVVGVVSRGRGRTLSDEHFQQVGLDLILVGLVFSLLVWSVYGLFPAELLVDGSFIDVFAHAAGFVEGALLAALTLVAFAPDETAGPLESV